MSKYYVLGQEGEPVLIDLGYEPGYGPILALAVYTSKDGGQRRGDLQRYKDTEVMAVSGKEVLAAVQRAYPCSVFLDGKKLTSSVFIGMLKTEVGLPIKHPQ